METSHWGEYPREARERFGPDDADHPDLYAEADALLSREEAGYYDLDADEEYGRES